MRDTLPPGAGTPPEASGPRGPKPLGGRRLPRRRVGGGDVGGEKYSSLELDAPATVGDTTASGGGADDGGAELGDEVGDGGRVLSIAAALRVNIIIVIIS